MSVFSVIQMVVGSDLFAYLILWIAFAIAMQSLFQACLGGLKKVPSYTIRQFMNLLVLTFVLPFILVGVYSPVVGMSGCGDVRNAPMMSSRNGHLIEAAVILYGLGYAVLFYTVMFRVSMKLTRLKFLSLDFIKEFLYGSWVGACSFFGPILWGLGFVEFVMMYQVGHTFLCSIKSYDHFTDTILTILDKISCVVDVMCNDFFFSK